MGFMQQRHEGNCQKLTLSKMEKRPCLPNLNGTVVNHTSLFSLLLSELQGLQGLSTFGKEPKQQYICFHFSFFVFILVFFVFILVFFVFILVFFC